MKDRSISIALIGLGEVGSVFAEALAGRTDVDLRISSRASVRATAAAARTGLPLETDPAKAVAGADLVLLTVPGDALPAVMEAIRGAIHGETLVADFTSAEPEAVRSAARRHPGGAEAFVDATIMGAVSMQGSRTPVLASGAQAERFAATMGELGFVVRAMPGSAPGDASRVKLLRSVFAKGLEGLMVETALAARAAGLDEELMLQFDNSDRMPLREHMAMYLRTHPLHARRRLQEMEAAERQLMASGVPSLTTRAAIERYRHTIALLDAHPVDPSTFQDASAATDWLLRAESGE